MRAWHEKTSSQERRVTALMQVLENAAAVVFDLKNDAFDLGQDDLAARAAVLEGYLLRALDQHGQETDR